MTSKTESRKRALLARRKLILCLSICLGSYFTKERLGRRDVLNVLDEGFFVISLQDVQGASHKNQGRLDLFKRDVNTVCGKSALTFSTAKGYVDRRRGFGLTRAFVDVLDISIEQGLEKIYIFEDDVRLMNTLFCDRGFRQALWAEAPRDTFVIIFAGHNTRKTSVVESRNFLFEAIDRHYGSYAWAISRTNFEILRRYWKSLLQDGSLKELSPDIDLSSGHFHNMTTHLLRTPQLCFHPAGYSNTWSKQRGPVQDIELPSLVVLCQSRSEIEDILRLASWRKILAEIIVVVERMNFDEKDLKNTTVSVRLMNNDNDSPNMLWSTAARATSSVVAIVLRPERISIRAFEQLHGEYLQRPDRIAFLDSHYSEDDKPLARKHSTCQKCSRLQRSGALMTQRRYFAAYTSRSKNMHRAARDFVYTEKVLLAMSDSAQFHADKVD